MSEENDRYPDLRVCGRKFSLISALPGNRRPRIAKMATFVRECAACVPHQNGELAQFSAGDMALPYREFLPARAGASHSHPLNQPNQCRGAGNIRALDSRGWLDWPSQKRSINVCSFFSFLRFIFFKKKNNTPRINIHFVAVGCWIFNSKFAHSEWDSAAAGVDDRVKCRYT